MRHAKLACLSVTLLTLLTPQHVRATDVDEEFLAAAGRSDIVFVGVVESTGPCSSHGSGFGIVHNTVRYRLEAVLRGVPESGPVLAVGYVVPPYADDADDVFDEHLCLRNTFAIGRRHVVAAEFKAGLDVPVPVISMPEGVQRMEPLADFHFEVGRIGTIVADADQIEAIREYVATCDSRSRGKRSSPWIHVSRDRRSLRIGGDSGPGLELGPEYFGKVVYGRPDDEENPPAVRDVVESSRRTRTAVEVCLPDRCTSVVVERGSLCPPLVLENRYHYFGSNISDPWLDDHTAAFVDWRHSSVHVEDVRTKRVERYSCERDDGDPKSRRSIGRIVERLCREFPVETGL